LQPSSFVIAVYEFVLLLFSLSVHECAHAWMASRLGDQTARMQGRVSLNPMVHADPIGTFVFPALMIFGPFFGLGMFGGMLVGWAKPVPVITRNFRKIVRDDSLVSMAGPFSNLLLALIAFFSLAGILFYENHLPMGVSPAGSLGILGVICEKAILVNLALFFFNLLPIPPLDGSRVLRHMLPYNALNAYDRMGMFSYVLMLVVGAPIVRFFLTPTIHLINLALNSI
jgi:Zn-dependent protease